MVERGRRIYSALVLKRVFWFFSRILLKTRFFFSLWQKAVMAPFQLTLHFKAISSEYFKPTLAFELWLRKSSTKILYNERPNFSR